MLRILQAEWLTILPAFPRGTFLSHSPIICVLLLQVGGKILLL
jgi:hypothetical protein